jgi:hypothetical protein
VAHLTDGTLRRMVDDPDARSGPDAAHLDGCVECRGRFDSIAADARAVAALLAVPDAEVDVARAYQRVAAAPRTAPVLPLRLPGSRPVRLGLVAAVAAAAMVVVAFAANGFFYQPSKVKTVPVTVADVQALSQLADYGTITWTKQPDFQATTSAAQAAEIAGGLQPPAVGKLPAGVSTTVTYAAMSQAQATFTFSAAKAQAAAAAHGKTAPAMPAGMDGATLTVTVGPAVGEVYGDLSRATGQGTNATPGAAPSPESINLPQLVVARSAAPTATATQVGVTDLENFILAQPGISAGLRDAIKAIGDPSSTLLIPVPIQYATSTQVTVQGVQGVALGDNTGLGSGVVWLKGGQLYVVAGSVKQSEAIDVANNLK